MTDWYNSPPRSATMMITRQNALLVVIDIQEKLVAAMPEKVLPEFYAANQRLIQGAAILSVPVLRSEQYPQGLGPTVADLESHFQTPALSKTTFSCVGCEPFSAALRQAARQHIILTGMETHICVYQTALALLNAGHQVWIPAECVLSRSKKNWKSGLAMMQTAGAIICNVESLLFQMLGGAGIDGFKEISRLVR